jgi:maltose O-acetyltransferase
MDAGGIEIVLSEREKMARGLPFRFSDPDLSTSFDRAQVMLRAINATPIEDPTHRRDLLEGLLGYLGAGARLKPPFQCDYGFNIRIGAQSLLNYGCIILDSGPVTIGDHVWIGPGVHIYTANHPLDRVMRRSDLIVPSGVAIGDDVWIGGGAIICPGVTIGPGSVIGAGSVVTKDIPSGVFAAGNPCAVRRELEPSGIHAATPAV